MYLAQKIIKKEIHYIIRKSIKIDGVYIFRDLFYLGTSPWKFIHYEGRNAFYIDEEVINSISEKGIKTDQTDLEHLFIQFLPQRIQNIIKSFDNRKIKKDKNSTTNVNRIHPFDKFRLYYLKFQDHRQRYINSLPPEFFFVLSKKSRDEIEQYFMEEEKKLRKNEEKDYIFASFNLQYYFSSHLHRQYPEICDQKKLDNAFIEQLCNLNKDNNYLLGVSHFKGIYHYLKRYMWMFFDNDVTSTRINQKIMEDFINRHRVYRPVVKKIKATVYIKHFGKNYDELKKTDIEEIKKIFRKRAKELHPDKGGTSVEFNELIDCYKTIIK